jgi:L,D-peptidoglycan transpeptidase YkuD (ErfK/YbiS/YcfS/YnhG family)
VLRPEDARKAPAAVVCRRRLWCVNLLGMILAATSGCARAEPAGRWAGVREGLDRSIRELRGCDPATAERVQALAAEAERITAAEGVAPPWSRQTGRVERAWERAVETARRGLLAARGERAKRLRRLETVLDEARASIAAARSRRGRAGMAREEAALLAAAEFRLGAARRLAATGDLQGALAQAAAAREEGVRLAATWEAVHERFSDPGLLRRWRRQAADTVAQSRRTGESAIVIDKLQRRLTVYRSGLETADFEVELGSGGLQPKRRAGDRATPEGRYRITDKKSGTATRYHLALLIDYPNAEDRRRFERSVKAGEIPRGAGPGGLIEIHGGGGSGRDWTDGCVALTDRDMDRLFSLVRVGTPVTIVGAL